MRPLDPKQAPQLIARDPSLNNMPAVQFISADPTVGYGPALGSGTWRSAILQPATYYAVVQTSNGTSFKDGFSTVFDTVQPGRGRHWFYIAEAGADLSITSTAGYETVDTPGNFHSQNLIVSAIVNGDQSQFFINSVKPMPTTVAGVATVSSDGVTIGATYAGNATLQGRIAEVIVYRALHDESTRTKVMDYLSARYCIPIAH